MAQILIRNMQTVASLWDSVTKCNSKGWNSGHCILSHAKKTMSHKPICLKAEQRKIITYSGGPTRKTLSQCLGKKQNLYQYVYS
jgi:hypothetical protein